MRRFVSPITLALLSVAHAGPLHAQTTPMLELQTKALQVMSNAAERICNSISTSGNTRSAELSGNAKAALTGVIKNIAELGMDGAGKYQTTEYNNVLQQDLANAIRTNADCKKAVFDTLVDRMLPKQSGLNSPPAVAVHPTDRKLVFQNSYLRATVKQAASNKMTAFAPTSYNNSVSIELENTSNQSYALAVAYNAPKSISILGSKGSCEDPKVSGIGEVAYWNGQILTGAPTTLEPGDRLIMNLIFYGCLTGFSGLNGVFTGRLMRFTQSGLQSMTVSVSDIHFE
jgi:hypothetical protein